jgi:hypothetical protein
MKNIEIAILHDDVRWVEADLLALKYAAGFHGADEVVAQEIWGGDTYTEQVVKGIEENGHFFSETKYAIQSSNVIFIKMPPLTSIRYRQIFAFPLQALELASRVAPSTKHLAMTIHGPGFGMDVSVCFLAQLAGILEALAKNSFPKDLSGISIVNNNAEIAAHIALLLRYRFLNEPYAHASATGATQAIDLDKLQAGATPVSNELVPE